MDEKEKQKYHEQHELSHDLADAILDVIDEFLMDHGRRNVSPTSLLLGAEIASSVCRRLARDTGVPRDIVKSTQTVASRCGGEVYGERYANQADAAPDPLDDGEAPSEKDN